MDTGTFIAIYFVVWWLCLFVVLPFGVRNQVDQGEWQPGTDPGAPSRTGFTLWRKLLATTLVAAVATPLIMWAIAASGIEHYWQR